MILARVVNVNQNVDNFKDVVDDVDDVVNVNQDVDVQIFLFLTFDCIFMISTKHDVTNHGCHFAFAKTRTADKTCFFKY